MKLLNVRECLTLASLFFAACAAHAQEADSLTVPTPSFSNPGSAAVTTQVPSTGTTLRPLQPVRLPSGGQIIKEEKVADESSAPSLDPTADESMTQKVPKGTPEPEGDKVAATAEEPKKNKTTEIRVEMLEKIGDQLSLRMRSIKEREDALTQRERSLIEREERAAERENMIRQIEESLLQRESMVRRREQLPPPQVWQGGEAPSVNAQYAAVLDGKTMQFYHTKNATSPTPVASTQKLMTALVICDSGSLDEIVIVDRQATLVEPTTVGIKTGEHYTRRQLLTALLVKSGNDLAAALAIDNAGSVEAFANKMNLMGKRIGLVNSNFKTPHGLPAEGQYSCARDIGIIAFEAYQNPEIREIVKTKSYRFEFNDNTSLLLSNTNRLLREWDICNGMKTGFTYAAGRCLVSSASENGEDRISVVIKTTNEGVWSDSKKLLQWALGLQMLGPMSGFDS